MNWLTVSLFFHLIGVGMIFTLLFAGPIVEIGTLLGVSTTHMALWKTPDQRIITVDLFAWNPWGIPITI